MKNKQSEIFERDEGNQWYLRNQHSYKQFDPRRDPVCVTVESLVKQGAIISEVGCGFPSRLAYLSGLAETVGHGIDPSSDAIATAKKQHPRLALSTGSADKLPWSSDSIDILIYGFCLYLVDRIDLFKIAAEGDRVLKTNGIIVVYDFIPPTPYFNEYKYRKDIHSYKMNYSKLWSWNPQYIEIKRHSFGHGTSEEATVLPDDRVGVSVLLKQNIDIGYPKNPISVS